MHCSHTITRVTSNWNFRPDERKCQIRKQPTSNCLSIYFSSSIASGIKCTTFCSTISMKEKEKNLIKSIWIGRKNWTLVQTQNYWLLLACEQKGTTARVLLSMIEEKLLKQKSLTMDTKKQQNDWLLPKQVHKFMWQLATTMQITKYYKLVTR